MSNKRRRPPHLDRLYISSARGRGAWCIARLIVLGRRVGPCVCDHCLRRREVSPRG